VREVLQGVTAEMAARRPLASAHTIWELVLHMTAWKDVVARRLGGESITQVPPDQDFPKVTDTSESAWEGALARLEATHARLFGRLTGMRDDQLDEPPAPKATRRYIVLHGILQHDLYHAGQIAILRKG
jgi:uncharacterized damage-inducible protein DinB